MIKRSIKTMTNYFSENIMANYNNNLQHNPVFIFHQNEKNMKKDNKIKDCQRKNDENEVSV